MSDVMSAVPTSNVAVTVVLLFAVVAGRVHVPRPVHGPDQPANVVPALGVAVSVTVVLTGKLAVQVGAHVMPAGTLVTVPVPVPAGCTTS